ncbi:DeoR/GlpR family DNA-binding transcription regulator [Halobacillus shinanisalinarum]|uniref:DeoR/GlpR family DNA-binding transcription regulator n=1 Tax=Halobacillus shinanisalinarum TaxID=2932258 RepID=A0ABY4H367_9BACI|nr:DeoR/GlpR family DNA-binding transcription regulator [Halobacillus shinanisalinarum]UOQ94868.1 DeoR/GlpR family DNA-binding transcription regulator [Halobacillus shinanisalinarum]
MTLLSDERKSNILLQIEENGKVKVRDLAIDFNVSMETIRRDLDELEAEKRIRKVYGGALKPESSTSEEPPMFERKILRAKEKKRIGSKAASLVNDGDVIFIDEGSTTLQMAAPLLEKTNVTIITNFFPLMKLMMEYEQKKLFVGELIFLGGRMNSTHSRSSGSYTEKMAKTFFVDKAFISVDGVDPNIGLTSYQSEKCSLSQIFISHTRQAYALVDHSKLGVKANFKMESMEAFSHVICDVEAPSSWKLTGTEWVQG